MHKSTPAAVMKFEEVIDFTAFLTLVVNLLNSGLIPSSSGLAHTHTHSFRRLGFFWREAVLQFFGHETVLCSRVARIQIRSHLVCPLRVLSYPRYYVVDRHRAIFAQTFKLLCSIRQTPILGLISQTVYSSVYYYIAATNICSYKSICSFL